MQIKAALQRHGWFLGLLVLGLVLARTYQPLEPGPALAPDAGRVKDSPAAISVLPTRVSLPSPTDTARPAASATSTASPSPTATGAPSPTAIPLPRTTPQVTATFQTAATAQPIETPLPTWPAPEAAALSAPPADSSGHPRVQPVVLANYYPWYDPETWSSGCTSDADRPASGAYNSDDVAVITRHLAEARRAGLDGFAVHWYARGNRTDLNLARLLDNSPGGFNSTLIFLCHIVGCASSSDVVNQLTYVITTWGAHPHFFRINGKPVIMFSDMGRVPGAGGAHAAARDIWGQVRQAVDPDHNTWWIAEGLEPGYLQVFDGLYVYKIDHACCPQAAAQAPTWAGWVRDWEQRTGQARLWVGTVMPGWNDVNSVSSTCRGPDSRAGVVAFARDRENGAYYNRTWDTVLPTQPDFILLNSFNEWIEGTYIEPSVQFGDLYLELTAAGVARFKSGR